MKPYVLGIALLLAGPLAAGEKKLKVVASTPTLQSIVEEVGGDRVEAEAICRPDQDPHFVDMKPSLIMRLRKADLIVRIGMELDQWMDAMIEQSGNRAIQRGQPANLDASGGVEKRDVPAVVDRSNGDVHPYGDPHYWLDPANAPRIAAEICDTLCVLDPGSAKEYQARRDSFGKRLEEKLAGWQKRLEPFKGRAIITFHRSFGYFMSRFGFTVPIELEPKPGIEPSAEHLDKVVRVAKSQRIACILQEPFRVDKPGKFVSEQAGSVPVLVLHDEPAPKEGIPGYLTMMDRLVEGVAQAMEKAR